METERHDGFPFQRFWRGVVFRLRHYYLKVIAMSSPPAPHQPTELRPSLWTISSAASAGAVILAVTGSVIASPAVLVGAVVAGGIGALTGILASRRSSSS